MSAPTPPGRPRIGACLADPWLGSLLLLGALLRAGLVLWIGDDLVLRGDSGTYAAGAERLRHTGVLETGHFVRPPLYFAFLAACAGLSDALGARPWLLAQLLQALLSLATALPVYRTAHRLGGPVAARLAAGFLLLDPTLVALSHWLWPETLLLFLVAVLFDALPGLEDRRLGSAALPGAGFGALLLVKPVLGLMAPLLALGWLTSAGARRGALLTLVFGAAALLVVLPWTVRNQLRYGPSILLENQAPYNLWIGNDPRPAREVLDEWIALGDPARRSRVGWRRGWESIREDPMRFARSAAGRALNLWGLEFFVVRLPVVGGYPGVERGGLLALFWVVQGAWAATLLAAVLGRARSWRDPTLRVLWVYAALFTALVAALAVTTRFRVPFAFPLCVAAGLGAQRALARSLTRRDGVALLAALALLLASASRPLFRTLVAGDFRTPAELDRPDWHYFRY